VIMIIYLSDIVKYEERENLKELEIPQAFFR